MATVTTANIRRVWSTLFPEPLQPDEWVECHHGSTKYPWSRAIYVQDVESLISALREMPARDHMYGIHWTTKRRPDTLHKAYPDERKRSDKKDVLRAWGMIVDIEDSRSHKSMNKADCEKMLNKAWQALPDWLQECAQWVGYTGGGAHIYVKFTRPVAGLERLEALGKALLASTAPTGRKNRWIDAGSFNPAHGQRLLGTVNQKYNTPTSALDGMRNNCGGALLDVDEYLPAKALQVADKRSVEYSDDVDHFSLVKCATDIVNTFHIRTKGDWRDNKIQAFCPAWLGHDDNKNPGGSVIRSEDGSQLFHCFHEGQTYSAIDLWMKMEGVSERDALYALAERSGVSIISPQRMTRHEGPQVPAPPSALEMQFDIGAFMKQYGCVDDLPTLTARDDGAVFTFRFMIDGVEQLLELSVAQLTTPGRLLSAMANQIWTVPHTMPDAKALRAWVSENMPRIRERMHDHRTAKLTDDESRALLIQHLQEAERVTDEDVTRWARMGDEDGGPPVRSVTVGGEGLTVWESEGRDCIVFRLPELCTSVQLSRAGTYTIQRAAELLVPVGAARKKIRIGSRRVYVWTLPLLTAEDLGYERTEE